MPPLGEGEEGSSEHTGTSRGRLTVLFDAGGRRLTKGYRQDKAGKVTKTSYPNTSEYIVSHLEFSGFDGFAAAVELAATHNRGAAIIRGTPGKFLPLNGPIYRLKHRQEGLVYARSGKRVPTEQVRRQGLEADGVDYYAATFLPMFEERPQSFVFFDVDKVLVPSALGSDWVDEPELAAEHVVTLLPECFHDASYWFGLSASAAEPTATGRKVAGTIKIKLAFLLDRPLAGAVLDAWMAAVGAPVDPVVFRTVQLIYVAVPTFQGGLHDPIPRRWGICRGLSDVVEVPAELPQPTTDHDIEFHVNLDGLDSGDGLATMLEVLRERLKGEVHVREHLGKAIWCYCALYGPGIDREALGTGLTAVAGCYRSQGEVAGYNLPSLIDWYANRARPVQTAAEPDLGLPPMPPHYPANEQEPEAASARLVKLVGQWARDGLDHKVVKVGLDEPPGGHSLGIRGAASLGKTTAVINAVIGDPWHRPTIDVYVPTHQLANEWAAKARAAGGMATAFRGRGHKDPEDKYMCQKHIEAQLVAESGANVWQSMCELKLDEGEVERCEFYAECPYIAQYRRAEGIRVFTHDHMALPRKENLIGSPDLVVVDETFATRMAHHTSIALDRLTAERPWQGRRGGISVVRLADINALAWKLRRALEAGIHPREAGLTVEDCELAAGIEGMTIGDLPVTPGMRWADQRRVLSHLRKSEALRLWRMWKVLGEEIARPGPMQRILLRRNIENKKAGEIEDRVCVYWRATLRAADVPTLFIAADLDPVIYRQFWPTMTFEAIAARRNAEVIQIVDTRCSKRRLLGCESATDRDKQAAAARMAELQLLFAAEARKAPTLLIGTKAVTEQLTVAPGGAMAHFGALRGLDRFKDFATVILVGREQPCQDDVEALTRSLFGDDVTAPLHLTGEFVEVRRGYRMRDGSHRSSKPVQVLTDPRAQAILEGIRERECEQAIDRLRLVHRQVPARVLVLCNIPLDLTVDRLTTWEAIMPSRWERTSERLHGCIPISPCELARLAGDLWGTPRAAQLRLGRMGQKGTQLPISTSALSPAATLVEYRRAGQRGSGFRAWLPGDVFCSEAARLVLEDAGFGPITVTRIVETRREPEPESSAPTVAEPWPLPEDEASIFHLPQNEPPSHIPPSYRDDWRERVAVALHDGGVSLHEAEREATEFYGGEPEYEPGLLSLLFLCPPDSSSPRDTLLGTGGLLAFAA